jgi:hypothetical protein
MTVVTGTAALAGIVALFVFVGGRTPLLLALLAVVQALALSPPERYYE